MKNFLKDILKDFDEVIQNKKVYYILLIIISLMIYSLIGFIFLGI